MTMTALSPPSRRASAGWLGTRRRSIVAQASRCLGALAVLATGIAHIEQYSVDDYSTVPTIGTLFLLNFIAAIVIAVGLIAPLRRVTGATPTPSAPWSRSSRRLPPPYYSSPSWWPTARVFRRSARVHNEPPEETPVSLLGRSVSDPYSRLRQRCICR